MASTIGKPNAKSLDWDTKIAKTAASPRFNGFNVISVKKIAAKNTNDLETKTLPINLQSTKEKSKTAMF